MGTSESEVGFTREESNSDCSPSLPENLASKLTMRQDTAMTSHDSSRASRDGLEDEASNDVSPEQESLTEAQPRDDFSSLQEMLDRDGVPNEEFILVPPTELEDTSSYILHDQAQEPLHSPAERVIRPVAVRRFPPSSGTRFCQTNTPTAGEDQPSPPLLAPVPYAQPGIPRRGTDPSRSRFARIEGQPATSFAPISESDDTSRGGITPNGMDMQSDDGAPSFKLRPRNCSRGLLESQVGDLG